MFGDRFKLEKVQRGITKKKRSGGFTVSVGKVKRNSNSKTLNCTHLTFALLIQAALTWIHLGAKNVGSIKDD